MIIKGSFNSPCRVSKWNSNEVFDSVESSLCNASYFGENQFRCRKYFTQHLWSLNSEGLLRPHGYPFKRLYSRNCAIHSSCRAFDSGAVTSSYQSRHFIGMSLFCYSLSFQMVCPCIWTNFNPRTSKMFYVRGSGDGWGKLCWRRCRS